MVNKIECRFGPECWLAVFEFKSKKTIYVAATEDLSLKYNSENIYP